MPKTPLVNQSEVKEFLEIYQSEETSAIKAISEGNHSEAYSYNVGEKEYVVRFNEKDDGFWKDKYAYKIFSSEVIRIPKIDSIGIYKAGIFYSISERIMGETV